MKESLEETTGHHDKSQLKTGRLKCSILQVSQANTAEMTIQVDMVAVISRVPHCRTCRNQGCNPPMPHLTSFS